MGDIPRTGMAVGAVAGRNTRLQSRNGGMAEGAISTMGDINRRVSGATRIVTVITWTCESYIPGHHMVNTAVYGQFLVRMASQTVGRVGTCCDGGHDLLSRAVMTGRTGTGPVGGNIMLDTFDLGPGRNHMADAAERTRSVEGEVAGAQCNRMSM